MMSMSCLAVLVLALTPGLPKSMTVSLGGFSLQQDKLTNACRYDANSGYYLIKTWECDGGHRSIRLTRDRRLVEQSGYDIPNFGTKPEFESPYKIEPGKLALATKHGVGIGETRTAVERLLGKPARTMSRGAYSAILYRHREMFDKENGEVFRNTYIFKNGKLIEVLLNLDGIPGCGGDGDDETGWPWTKF